uniref:Uncharacterized protein n=1 Tax=Aegilops tauschii subsp. strangulata TaxID=200361 RepID=A0A453BCP1_AEGTS
MYLIVGLYLPQVSNVMLYLVVQILPPSRYNEEFTMVSAVRFVELIMPLRLSS